MSAPAGQHSVLMRVRNAHLWNVAKVLVCCAAREGAVGGGQRDAEGREVALKKPRGWGTFTQSGREG